MASPGARLPFSFSSKAARRRLMSAGCFLTTQNSEVAPDCRNRRIVDSRPSVSTSSIFERCAAPTRDKSTDSTFEMFIWISMGRSGSKNVEASTFFPSRCRIIDCRVDDFPALFSPMTHTNRDEARCMSRSPLKFLISNDSIFIWLLLSGGPGDCRCIGSFVGLCWCRMRRALDARHPVRHWVASLQNVHFRPISRMLRRIVRQLKQQPVAVSGGSACRPRSCAWS